MTNLIIIAFGFIMPIYGLIQHNAGEATPFTYILVGMASIIALDVILKIVLVVSAAMAAARDERDD